MRKTTEEYKWSSGIFYKTGRNGFISIDVLLDMLSSDRKEAINKYIEYMQKEEEIDHDNKKVLGEEAYQIMCSKRTRVEQKKRLDEILIDQGLSQEQYELVKKRKRRRDLTEYKVNYIREAIKQKYTHKEIGTNICMSDAAVRNLINRAK